jgi:hypothetical protein
MKIVLSLICICFALQTVTANEMLNCPLSFPNQVDFENYWELKAENGEPHEKIMDWAPLSKKAEESNESFTVQTYQFDQFFDLRMIYDKFVATLKENMDSPELLNIKVHSKGRKAISFEWWVDPPHKDAQREWVKLMKNKDNQLAIVRFLTKSELSESEKALWVECVAQAEFDLMDKANFVEIEETMP